MKNRRLLCTGALIQKDDFDIMKKAVALQYVPELPAPFVVAKGKGELAEKIKEIAKNHGVEIVSDPELAERLHAIDVGDFIPPDLYRIIAEILVFSLRLAS